MFFEKYQNFTYVSSGMYLMTICCNNCNTTVYSYKNKDYVIRRDRQNVTSESTPIRTFDLISIPLHAHNHANLHEMKKLHLENKATFNLEY